MASVSSTSPSPFHVGPTSRECEGALLIDECTQLITGKNRFRQKYLSESRFIAPTCRVYFGTIEKQQPFYFFYPVFWAKKKANDGAVEKEKKSSFGGIKVFFLLEGCLSPSISINETSNSIFLQCIAIVHNYSTVLQYSTTILFPHMITYPVFFFNQRAQRAKLQPCKISTLVVQSCGIKVYLESSVV